MSDELRELYQQMIVDHSKSPRNFGSVSVCSHCADGHNPLCGDQVHLSVLVDQNRIVDIKFNGAGCAISTASASMLTEIVRGKSIEEVSQLFDEFHWLVAELEKPLEEERLEKLGKLAVFSGVREFPARVKCAILCWHTLKKALSGGGIANTEGGAL